MRVYLDESGHEPGGHCVIAGFLGSTEQWDTFLPDWLSTLGSSESFHMKKLRWGKEATRRRLERLASIPYKHGLFPVVGAVNGSDFADLPANMAEAFTTQGYLVSLYPIIIEVLRVTPKTERIDWIFEEQVQYEMEARNIFRVLGQMVDGGNRIGDISYVSKEATCLTQPADFLAFAVLQQLRDPNSTKAHWCRPIFGDKPFIGSIVDRETIRGIMEFALPAAALKTTIETGNNPRVQFTKFKTKADVREALKAERARRGKPSS
jgi:hypothetical protein